VLALIRANTPLFFAPAEEEDLRRYLNEKIETYLVVEVAGKIVGAGGINYFPAERTARLAWDLIHPDWQGKSIGKALTERRINSLRQDDGVDSIVVRTTQLAYQFYEKLGFKLTRVEPDFWAEGFDLYDMQQRK